MLENSADERRLCNRRDDAHWSGASRGQYLKSIANTRALLAASRSWERWAVIHWPARRGSVLERADHQPVAVDAQPLECDGPAREVAAKTLEFVTLMVFAGQRRVQVTHGAAKSSQDLKTGSAVESR
jgi:hypothetical protein